MSKMSEFVLPVLVLELIICLHNTKYFWLSKFSTFTLAFFSTELSSWHLFCHLYNIIFLHRIHSLAEYHITIYSYMILSKLIPVEVEYSTLWGLVHTSTNFKQHHQVTDYLNYLQYLYPSYVQLINNIFYLGMTIIQ